MGTSDHSMEGIQASREDPDFLWYHALPDQFPVIAITPRPLTRGLTTINTQLFFQRQTMLHTLKGGVSNYLKNEGSAEWVGNLFVFDDRLSLPPGKFADEGTGEEEGGINNGEPPSSPRWTGRCYVCGSEVEELRHRNCASIDCNRLYLCCGWCLEELRGCCCSECRSAPRLRPLLPGHQRYDKWHLYRDNTSTVSS